MDISGDGRLDLFVANGYDVSRAPEPQADRLYLNAGPDGLVSAEGGALTDGLTFSSASTWGDFNNDGNLDVFIAVQRGEPNRLLRGTGGGGFVDVSNALPQGGEGPTFAASWVDVNGNGFLDLFISNGGLTGVASNVLLRNRGDGTFDEAPGSPVTSEVGANRGGVWGDCNGNGRPDLFVPRGWSSAGITGALYRNDGDWAFTPLPESAPASDTINAFGAAWGDFDNDGHLDLVVVGSGINRLYRNLGDCTFERVTQGGPHLLDGGDSYSVHWVDYNNDGLLDLLVVNWGSPPILYTNVGAGRFERFEHGDLGRQVTHAGGASWGDMDGDGYLDLYLANWPNWPGGAEENHLYRNRGGTGNGWLGVSLEGTRSNRSAIGARVRVKASIGGADVWQLREVTGSTGFRSQDPLRQHFGLGDAPRADLIEVWWPSGLRERFPGSPGGRVVTLTEGEGTPLPPD